MARIKATHTGTCQICGCNQKLPGGLMSLHGYKKGNGFFEGACTGSNHPPIEVSCSLIRAAIPGVLSRIKSLKASSEKLKQLPELNDNKAWVNYYHSNRSFDPAARKSGYYWIQATIEKTRNGVYKYQGIFDGKPVNGVHSTYLPDLNTVSLLAQHTNTKYAKQVLDKKISIGEDYVIWARDVVKNWKPGTLAPIK